MFYKCKIYFLSEIHSRYYSTCFEALSAINDTLEGLIVLDSKKPIGFINDGDIRRLILNGGKLTDNVSKAMQKEFLKMKMVPSYSESVSLVDKELSLYQLFPIQMN